MRDKLREMGYKEALIMPIADNLKRLRKKKGYTQSQLSDLAKIGSMQVSKIERGTTKPELDTIKKLVIALGTTADELIFDEGEIGPDEELKSLFNEVKSFTDDEKEVAKTMLRALILQHLNEKTRRL